MIALYNHWGPTAGGLSAGHPFAQAFQTNPYRIEVKWPAGINSTTGIQLTNGQQFSLPVTIWRDPGYVGDVLLAAAGLPAGVEAWSSIADPSHPAVEQRTLTFGADTDLPSDATVQALIESYVPYATTPDVTIPIRLQVTAARIDSITPVNPGPDGVLFRGGWATIQGAGLTPGSAVYFGSSTTPAPIGWTSGDGSWIQVQVPDDATDGQVKVVTPSGATLVSSQSYEISNGMIEGLSTYEGDAPRG